MPALFRAAKLQQLDITGSHAELEQLSEPGVRGQQQDQFHSQQVPSVPALHSIRTCCLPGRLMCGLEQLQALVASSCGPRKQAHNSCQEAAGGAQLAPIAPETGSWLHVRCLICRQVILAELPARVPRRAVAVQAGKVSNKACPYGLTGTCCMASDSAAPCLTPPLLRRLAVMQGAAAGHVRVTPALLGAAVGLGLLAPGASIAMEEAAAPQISEVSQDFHIVP